MKNKFFAVFVCCLSVLLGFGCISFLAEGNTIAEVKSLADGILAYKLKAADCENAQEWLDTVLTREAGTLSEWYVLALVQYGDYDIVSYETALRKYLSENKVTAASSRLKYALLLASVGSTDKYISNTLNDSIGKQGIMSLVFGLHLLNNGYQSDVITRDALLNQILGMQKTDGGWTVVGEVSDNDVTAFTVQALAPYYSSNESCKNAIDSALVLLSERQLKDGDFASYGVANPESTAQVMVALSSLGIDFDVDTRFIKNGNTLLDGLTKYLLSDGSFCRKVGDGSNEMATEQAFCACVSYLRMKQGQAPFYVLDNRNPEAVEPPTNTGGSHIETETPEDTGTGTQQNTSGINSQISYKVWVIGAIVFIGCSLMLVLFFRKKKSYKNYIAIILLMTAGILFVCVTEFKNPDSYYSGAFLEKEHPIGTVTLSIRCDTVAGKSEHIPKDGVILPATSIQIENGETVYDILTQAAQAKKIQVENDGNESLAYILGIAYLYEFDYGDLSGWVYFVNGERTSVGCGEYVLKDGDIIEWKYTCNLGEDLK